MIQNGEINTNLARVPHDMAFDVDAMTEQFGKQAGIVRDAFIYVIKRQFTSKDIFNNITFSIDDFCRDMGYNKSELYRRLDIWNNKNKPPKLIDGHECDSLFEYALYRAAKENVIFHRWSKDGNPIINTYQIFKSVEILYDATTKKNTKRTYSIVLGSDILNAAFARFFVLDYEDYKNLAAKSSDATSSYRNFYIFYARMVATAKARNQHNYITTVDDLANVFNYTISVPKNRKTSVKRALDNIKSKMTYSFNYQFIADPNPENKSKLQYHVLFQFSDVCLTYFEEKLVGFWAKLLERVGYSYMGSLKKDNTDYHERQRAIGQPIDKEKLFEWWFSNADQKRKNEILNSVIKDIFPNGRF
ncbi:MAG: hypothetical protein LBB90_02700 [Tannerella sp.]|jgi:hypothetical protein|nr:hypothetical protein [Tannerella sp.]